MMYVSRGLLMQMADGYGSAGSQLGHAPPHTGALYAVHQPLMASSDQGAFPAATFPELHKLVCTNGG